MSLKNDSITNDANSKNMQMHVTLFETDHITGIFLIIPLLLKDSKCPKKGANAPLGHYRKFPKLFAKEYLLT